MTTWSEYTAMARRLDQLRRADEESGYHVEQRRATTARTLAALHHRLTAQQQRLAALGGAIGQPMPGEPIARAEVTDPDEALGRARQALDAADADAQATEVLAAQPPLLPTWPPLYRNLLVYGVCALGAVILQAWLLVLADVGRVEAATVIAWMCAGLPAMAFFGGYLLISRLGKPRVGGAVTARHPRLGFAICFLAMPAAYCAYKLLPL